MSDPSNKFKYSIVVPTILAIAMFIVGFYAVILPMFERSMMERKEEMIVELTNAAWSVLAEYEEAHRSGTLTMAQAKQGAAEHIGKMRYGQEQKDYFWIISTEPEMVMHPYRSDLIGRDLSEYKDDHENRLFVDAAQLVKAQGAGVIQYYWQWKDDASKIVPKLSYVKGFEPWQWIIGTGIYLEDVAEEIKILKRRLLTVSFVITAIIIFILVYVLQQTRAIEEKRLAAEHQLKLSIEKYKSLVEAASEGTLMVVDNKIAFANLRFIELQGQSSDAMADVPITEVIEVDWSSVVARVNSPNQTYSFETRLLQAKPGMEKVVVSVTQVSHFGQVGYILVIKGVTEQERLRLDAKKLSDDVELSLQLMNQPVHNLIHDNICCNLSDTVGEAAAKMSAHKVRLVCVKEEGEVIGVLTDSDLRHRVLAKHGAPETPIRSVMTSPIKTINRNALLYEAILKFQQLGVSHLLVENDIGDVIGHIGNRQCLEMQRNSLSYLIQEINECTLNADLKLIFNKVPVLIQAIFTSSDNINSISRIITAVADAIHVRVMELALEEVGPAPCDFAFIAMGSEGRHEQTLKTDQDNAIIFADNQEESQRYFLKLAQKVNEDLHAIGFSRCEGDLMAGNPEWCNPLKVWKGYFSEWIHNPSVKSALDSSIFFDLRLIYGSQILVERLQTHIEEELEEASVFFADLSKTVSQQKLVLDKRQVDIKSLLVPLIGFLRVLALKHEIPETNSLLRLHQLMAYGLIEAELGQEIEKIYKFLMHLRIKSQVNLILDNDTAKNTVLLQNLTAIDRATLETIVRQVSQLQESLPGYL